MSITMYRYMTLLWLRTDPGAAQAADHIAAHFHELSPHAWRKAWDAPGMAVYDSGEHKGRMQTYRLASSGGVVLGRLFRNDYTSVIDDIDEFESRKFLETRGQRLINHYWGRYVAFLNDPASGATYVMRDPSGAFPCFYTSFRGVEIYFSDMQDVANFDFLPFTVNWEYLKTNIVFPTLHKAHTGLNEVSEILPAECVEITPFERSSRFLWDPTTISKSDVIENSDEAAHILYETINKTIGCVSSCYNSIVHNIGGLDSSIVLAALANAPNRPKITCITHFTQSPAGEERFYTRKVSEQFGIPLVESELDYREFNIARIFQSNYLVNPPGVFDGIAIFGAEYALAREKNAQALFTGAGGDNVFFQTAVNFGALDYVRMHGFLNTDTPKVAMEASRYGRTSIYRTFREILHESTSPEPCFDYVHKEYFENYRIPLINKDFIIDVGLEKHLHPLLIPSDHDLKGKYRHILGCAFFPNQHYPNWDPAYTAERQHAFFNQPIVEAALRIPIWILTHGGVDRGLARKAFKGKLPPAVSKRYTKAAPIEFYRKIYEHNLDFLREVLLDGILVKEKVLRRKELEQILCKQDIFTHVWHSQILNYVVTEVWLTELAGRNSRRIETSEIKLPIN